MTPITGEIGDILVKQYDVLLTALAVLTAVTGSAACFLALDNIRLQTSLWHRTLWSGIASIALVNAVWVSLYCATLALKLEYPIELNTTSSQLLTIPMTLVFLLVFNLLEGDVDDQAGFFMGSLMMALSIASMNFLFMKAMQVDAIPQYDYLVLTFAILLVIGTTFLALQCYFRYRSSRSVRHSLLAVIAMSTGIVLMHFISMSGYDFVRIPGQPVLEQAGLPVWVPGLILSLMPVLILGGILCGRLWIHNQALNSSLSSLRDEARLANLAFESHEGIIITAADRSIIRVNDAFTTITGYEANEVIGSDYMLLCSGMQSKTFYENLWDSVDKKGVWSGEYWCMARDDVEYPAWNTVTAVHNDARQITHYVIIFSDITQFKEAEASIHRLAYFDALTDLPNRRALYDHLARELAMARRYEKSGALLYFDLDHFKKINDNCGHNVGDEILRQCAKRVNRIIRHEDTAARLGGDEFVVVISATDKRYMYASEQAQAVAEKILDSFQVPFQIGQHRFTITTSIGIALFSSAHPNVDTVVKHADTAMYAAKEAGRNTIRFYESPLPRDVDDQLQLESRLRNAIEQNELLLYFHPYFDSNGKLAGAETLIRWSHPTEGLIAPEVFIPLAEQSGLLPEIGRWVFRTTFTRLKEWRNLGFNVPQLSINVSPYQFYQPDFVEAVTAEVNSSGVSAKQIVLELTEGVLLKNFEDAIRKMNQLRKTGIRFSIDDFGTGYSSLAYLKKLPVSQLKIDRSFIRDVVTDKNDATIVQAIIFIARGMNLKVIAEGIESEKQIRYLSSCGEIFFQGHYFSQPLPEKDFLEFVRSANYVSETFGISSDS